MRYISIEANVAEATKNAEFRIGRSTLLAKRMDCMALSNVSNTSSASGRNSSPSGVKRLPRVEREINLTPTSRSNFFICALKADWVIFIVCAASVKLPVLLYVIKLCSSCMVGNSFISVLRL